MKSISKKKISFVLMIMAFVLAGVSTPFAANAVTTTYTPLAPLPCIPSSGSKDENGAIIPSSVVTCKNGDLAPQTSVDIKTYVQYAVNLLIALAAVAAVFMLVWGGFEYMTTDAVQEKEEGRKKITNAIYGLLLVLCSFLILRTINPQFVQVPDSLVTPLNLGSKNIATDWLNQLNILSQSGAVAAQTKQLLVNLKLEQGQVDDLALSKADIQGRILSYLGAPANQQLSDADQVCQQITPGDSGLDNLCSDLIQNENDSNQIQGNMQLEKANGFMSNEMLKCLYAGTVSQSVSNACAQQSYKSIDKERTDDIAKLQALGQSDKVREVQDYATYSTAMVSMNSLLGTLSKSPYTDMLISDIKQMNTASLTILGTAMGSNVGKPVVGAGLGFIASQYVNNLTSTKMSAQDQKTAQVVIQGIKNSMLVSGSIQDPVIKQALQDQGQAIINALGGK